MSEHSLVPTAELEPGETVRQSFRADRRTYIRDHAWLAALAMTLGMGVLWVAGNPYVWTGAVGGLAAILVRGGYLASDELQIRWDLTDRRLLGPGGRTIALSSIDKVNILGSAVQIVTIGGDKHLVRYQARPAETRGAIETARS